MIDISTIVKSINKETTIETELTLTSFESRQMCIRDRGADNDAEMATMRNVAGEIKGAEAAVKKAIELGIKELVIYYDYMGIETVSYTHLNKIN